MFRFCILHSYALLRVTFCVSVSLLYLEVEVQQYFVTSSCMFLGEKTVLEIWLYLKKTNKQRYGANFLHLQPVADLGRNQRGEIGRQHVKAHSCNHFSLCFHHTSPTQTNDGASQIDHNIGAYVPYSFRTMSRVLLRPLPTEVQR